MKPNRNRNITDMMIPLIYNGDKPFKRKARTHQSNFRADILKVPFDPMNKFGKYGAFLMPEDAKKGLNFCDGFRQEIMEKIKVIPSLQQFSMMACLPICCAVSIYPGTYLFL